ncbi:MAG TPA: ABC transporter ATP-binding protein, partial [Pirellulaceae bacterium]|nr:ABC transporter ATP-binding protein [Pirellulaceae bacterium]
EKMGLLVITPSDKLLEHNPPDYTHVILGGRIVETGGRELAQELHSVGYERIRHAYPDDAAENDMNIKPEQPALSGM